MRSRSLIITAICGVSLLGWALGRGGLPATAAGPCPGDVGAADRGVGVAAVHGGRLVGTAGAAGAEAVASVPRHVATGRSGTAYVQDRTGDDGIVV